jgi:hypothetical protein
MPATGNRLAAFRNGHHGGWWGALKQMTEQASIAKPPLQAVPECPIRAGRLICVRTGQRLNVRKVPIV